MTLTRKLNFNFPTSVEYFNHVTSFLSQFNHSIILPLMDLQDTHLKPSRDKNKNVSLKTFSINPYPAGTERLEFATSIEPGRQVLVLISL